MSSFIRAPRPTNGSLEQLATAMLETSNIGKHRMWRITMVPDTSEQLHSQRVLLNYQQRTLFIAQSLEAAALDAQGSGNTQARNTIIELVAHQIAHRNVGETAHKNRVWSTESNRLEKQFGSGYTFAPAPAPLAPVAAAAAASASKSDNL